MERIYHENMTLPKKESNVIFVFGDNDKGIHGKGAARVALNKFGAIWGKSPNQLVGNSYGISTKKSPHKYMSLEKATKNILNFVEFTKEHPELFFFITEVGCHLAGFKESEIAPLFKECGSNCSLSINWKKYYE